MHSNKNSRAAVALGLLVSTLSFSSTALAYSVETDFDNDPATKETLDVYGTLRLSIDYADSDLGNAPEDPSIGLTDGGMSLSSNTSIIGVRGSYALADEPYTVLWQLEEKVYPDSDGEDTFRTRDTFLGVKTPAGLFRFGHLNTPFKEMGLRNQIFVTTVGDPFAILGKSSQSKARLDLRADNAVKWDFRAGGFQMSTLYSFGDTPGNNDTEKFYADDNDKQIISTSLRYAIGPVALMGAYDRHSEAYGGLIEGWRVGLRFKSGGFLAGAIYGDIDTDDNVLGGSLARSEYGAYIQQHIVPQVSVGAQWMHADESELPLGDDGADQYSLGTYYNPFSRLYLHVVGTITKNDTNGRYGTADFGHGDRVSTVRGGSPFALSVGAQYSF